MFKPLYNIGESFRWILEKDINNIDYSDFKDTVWTIVEIISTDATRPKEDIEYQLLTVNDISKLNPKISSLAWFLEIELETWFEKL